MGPGKGVNILFVLASSTLLSIIYAQKCRVAQIHLETRAITALCGRKLKSLRSGTSPSFTCFVTLIDQIHLKTRRVEDLVLVCNWKLRSDTQGLSSADSRAVTRRPATFVGAIACSRHCDCAFACGSVGLAAGCFCLWQGLQVP